MTRINGSGTTSGRDGCGLDLRAEQLFENFCTREENRLFCRDFEEWDGSFLPLVTRSPYRVEKRCL